MPEKSYNILVADDHPVFRDGIQQLLISLGHSVYQAANADEINQIIRYKPVDLVLLDLNMKPVQGFEALKNILRHDPTKKVIILTMYEETRYIKQVLVDGASGYLFKNAEKEEIKKAISTVMSGDKILPRELPENIKREMLNVKVADNSKQNERMREIMFLICYELSSKQIADILNLSTRTIEDYRSDIMELTQAKNVTGVMRYAIENGVYNDLILYDKFKSKLKKTK